MFIFKTCNRDVYIIVTLLFVTITSQLTWKTYLIWTSTPCNYFYFVTYTIIVKEEDSKYGIIIIDPISYNNNMKYEKT